MNLLLIILVRTLPIRCSSLSSVSWIVIGANWLEPKTEFVAWLFVIVDAACLFIVPVLSSYFFEYYSLDLGPSVSIVASAGKYYDPSGANIRQLEN